MCRRNSRGKRTTQYLFRIMQRSMIIRNGRWSRINLSHLYNQLPPQTKLEPSFVEPSLSLFYLSPSRRAARGILYHRYRLMCITHIKPRRLNLRSFPYLTVPRAEMIGAIIIGLSWRLVRVQNTEQGTEQSAIRTTWWRQKSGDGDTRILVFKLG